MLREEVTSMSEMEPFQYRTKNGDLKSFIDPAVYTNNRQFRLLLCHFQTVRELNCVYLALLLYSCILGPALHTWKLRRGEYLLW